MNSVAQEVARATQLLLDRGRVEAKLLITPVFNVLGYVRPGLSHSAAIQLALDDARKAGGGTVYVPKGVYDIMEPMVIHSNTTLLSAPGATLKRAAAISTMLTNGTTNAPGYTGDHDIAVIGGTWDNNDAAFPNTACTPIAFAHATNLLLAHATFQNGRTYHFVEFNACKHVRVIDCEFRDFVGAPTEALQFDLAIGEGAFPWPAGAPYDYTPCEDVEVRGCRFIRVPRGVGTHSSWPDVLFKGIRIIGNHFEDCSDAAIYFINWDSPVIQGNTFEKCWVGIRQNDDHQYGGRTICRGPVITGNTFRNFRRVKAANGDWTDIGIWITTGGTPQVGQIVGGVITGNTFNRIGRHAVALYYVEGFTVSGNTFEEVGGKDDTGALYGHAVLLYRSRLCSISGNVVRLAGKAGIWVEHEGYNAITGNLVTACLSHGIYLLASSHNTVSGNQVIGNGQDEDNVHSGIYLISFSDYNHVQGNTVRKSLPGSAITQRYGIQVGTADCNGNLVDYNDLYQSGQTNALTDAGTGTIKTSNRT